ncbi:protein-disulfide reductase [Rhodoferax saidenbachensis]|uniref:Protein-disulfide reductase n=1 Tax=Rhodoferax saidenbachensis TaxID=1484693 RepID=A0A1P8KF52_9BURK|nr:protein-disulfide reductase [Rhodoferax saidenbachensis]
MQNTAPSGSHAAVVQTEQVRAELVAHAPQGVQPGQPVWVGLQFQHQPHWHTYWKNAGDSGLPTQVQWTLPAGVTAGDIAWPTPTRIAIGSLANLGFENTVLLPVPLTIAKDFQPPLTGDLEIRLAASWLVCKETCIPQEGNFVLRLPVQGSTALHGAAFDAAHAAQPQAFAGQTQAQVNAQVVTVTVRGLPAAWRGKALNLYPETPELLETAATPGASDTLGAASGQQWKDGVWSASMPLSAQRSSSPNVLPVVLTLGTQSLRAEVPVTGDWPALAVRAGVSPALQAALDNNRAQPKAVDAGLTAWAIGLAAALLGGLILNLMPCVFPVLAIKVLGFAQQGTRSSGEQRAQGLAYTAGVVLSFVALGGLMLALRASGEQLGWGFQLQSPAVVAGLALLFTLLALNLAGWLNIDKLVGNLLPSSLASLQLRHPLADAFLSGVLAVAIASPCTAPFMGASLGYAISLPAAQALGIFAALGLGLALPYLLASWLPAVGRWLPRPGVWMEQLRRFMAFPMAATVVWLLWVLGHLSGVDGAASLLALLLALSMLLWSLQLVGRSRWVFASISIAACALLAGAIGPNVLKLEEAPAASTTAAEGWQAWAPARVQTALAAGKPVFVDFTAAWCITCQYNKKTTLANADVLADFAQRQVTLLRADWTRRDPAITEALGALGRSGVPVYVLYTPGKPPVVFSEILGAGELRAALNTL